MERPSPVPPYLRFVVPSACRNASKMTECCSGAIPIPVSITEKLTRLPVSGESESVTLPRSVNFSAFEMRFFRICSRRVESVKIV